jgi:hypothetical protein
MCGDSSTGSCFSFASSALACFRMGMSGSASEAKQRLLRQAHAVQQIDVPRIGVERVEDVADLDRQQ